ncbi:MAG: HIT family protein [Candidatus Hodarchaeota archaeon]
MKDYNYYNRNYERYQLDMDAYNQRVQTRPCFICEIVAKNPEYPTHIVFEDDDFIVFLDKYPRLYGWILVAPKEHREQVISDFAMEEYKNIQIMIYRIAKAVQEELDAERIYILSLGSNQGNSHVHWHIAPLPPGMPYHEQQNGVFKVGILKIPEEEQSMFAAIIRSKIEL